MLDSTIAFVFKPALTILKKNVAIRRRRSVSGTVLLFLITDMITAPRMVVHLRRNTITQCGVRSVLLTQVLDVLLLEKSGRDQALNVKHPWAA